MQNTVSTWKMSTAWVDSTYLNGNVLDRWAGYIGPGPCQGTSNIPSYVHDDYMMIRGGQKLTDPDKEFIQANGFCYYSGFKGDYPDYLYSDIIENDPFTNWNIINDNIEQQ